MHLSTTLGCDVVAVEQSDDLTLLIELEAPTPPTTTARAPATLQIVLDRSGSMGGDRLDGAKAALLGLVDRLDPTDNFGVVAFDTAVITVVPTAPLTDKHAVKQAIAGLYPGGQTDLSAGYLRGLQEARRAAGPTGATVVLISDGHANAGETDPERLGSVARDAHSHGVTTTTLGFGLGYDELLLSALAKGGAGNELFAEEADGAVTLLSGEVDGLLTMVAQAASLRVTFTPHVQSVEVLNDLPVAALPNGALLELGSFYAGETRRLLVKLRIPGIAALGLTQVATLDFTHVQLPALVQHTTTVPVHVNVVPGDQAAGRVPDPKVVSEALFQQTQRAKKESGRLLSQGFVGEASLLLATTGAAVRSASMSLPDAFVGELNDELRVLDGIADEARYDHSRAAKISSSDAAHKSRNRGRASRGGGVRLTAVESDATLTLEEWEVVRLVRVLPSRLQRVLRPSPTPYDALIAVDLAAALGADHPATAFFAHAPRGFLVERA